MKTFAVVLAAGLLAAGGVSADPLEDLETISHRHKIYEVLARGDDIFAVGFPGVVLHSADGSKSWRKLDVGTAVALFGVDMTADGRGVIVGRSGLVMTTDNGGKTWKKRKSGTKEHLFDVVFTDSGKAWAVGHFGTIIHSTDGGATWKPQSYDPTFPEPPEEEEGGGGRRREVLSISEAENEGEVDKARLNAVSFADDQVGWIVGEFGLVLHTADGGASWKRQRSVLGVQLFSVHALDAQRVLAVGALGSFMRSDDGGVVWTEEKTGVSEHLLDIWPVEGQLFVVGRDGLVMVRKGDGAPFERRPVGIYTWLNSVQFFDANKGLVAGGRGHLLKTTDGGKSWQRLSGK